MDITTRVDELNTIRKQLDGLYADYAHLEGKHCSRNQKAFQALYQAVDNCKGLLPQMFISYKNGKKIFRFDGFLEYIETTKERIHQLDTIDTLDLAAYIAAVKTVIAEKEAIRQALKGEHYQLAKQELDRLTGFNL